MGGKLKARNVSVDFKRTRGRYVLEEKFQFRCISSFFPVLLQSFDEQFLQKWLGRERLLLLAPLLFPFSFSSPLRLLLGVGIYWKYRMYYSELTSLQQLKRLPLRTISVNLPSLQLIFPRQIFFDVMISWGGVRLSPLGKPASIWPILPAPDDGYWWMWRNRWLIPWSSCQSSWLRIQRSGFGSRRYGVHSSSWVQLRSYLKEKVAAPV
jgi:hypothetical protein